MRSTTSYVWLMLGSLSAIQALENPLSDGATYMMSSSANGNGYYLGCGDDRECSMEDIDGFTADDGWTLHWINPEWRINSRGDTWALDVHSTGTNVFADNTISDAQAGELWDLVGWSDGTYKIQNPFWSDKCVDTNGDAPIMSDEDESALGQHWYFRSVSPQETVTSTTTSTSTLFVEASTTITTSITTCLAKRSIDSGALLKRSGGDLLSTTTNTEWSTSVVEVTNTKATDIATVTKTINSCESTSATATPSAVTTTKDGTVTVPQQTATPSASDSQSDTSITPTAGTASSNPTSSSTSVGAAGQGSSSAPVSKSTSGSSSKAWIAGAVVGPVVGIALIALGIFFFMRRRKAKTPEVENNSYTPSDPKYPIAGMGAAGGDPNMTQTSNGYPELGGDSSKAAALAPSEAASKAVSPVSPPAEPVAPAYKPYNPETVDTSHELGTDVTAELPGPGFYGPRAHEGATELP